MIPNFFSPEDKATNAIFAAGAYRFGETYFDPETQRADFTLRTHGQLTQTPIRGIAHVGDPNATTFGKVPWMSRQLARERYGAITALSTPRSGVESDSWLTAYKLVRRQMGLGWTIPLRDEFFITYPRR